LESAILDRFRREFPDSILESSEFRGDLTVVVKKDDIASVCRFLRDDTELHFSFLSDLTAVDRLGREPRFDVIYHLYSLDKNHRLRLKVRAGEKEAVPSVTSIWTSADWFEREVFDLFGIEFGGHPDLRRILMPDDWVGHPLRKDFPLTKEEVMFSNNKNRPPRTT
jgi:NADH-quinone oxidoreductase subunit C